MDKESLVNFKSLIEHRKQKLEAASDPKLFATNALKKTGYLNRFGRVADQYKHELVNSTLDSGTVSLLDINIQDVLENRPYLKQSAQAKHSPRVRYKRQIPSTIFTADPSKSHLEAKKKYSWSKSTFVRGKASH